MSNKQPKTNQHFDGFVTGLLTKYNTMLKDVLYDGSNGRINEYFNVVEKKTNIKREQLTYVIIAAAALYFIIGQCAAIICNAVGFAYPAYCSVKAIRTQHKEDDTKWLIYWTVFAYFSLIDCFASVMTSYFPIYWLFKVIFLVYLYLPQTNGALYLYKNYIDTVVSMFENVLGCKQAKSE